MTKNSKDRPTQRKYKVSYAKYRNEKFETFKLLMIPILKFIITFLPFFYVNTVLTFKL